MNLNEFAELFELKNNDKVTLELWADEFGNLLIDIEDAEDVMDYLKRKSDKLTPSYRNKIDGRNVGDLTKDEVIKKMGWHDIILNGRRDSIDIKGFKTKDKEIPSMKLAPAVYDMAIIYSPGVHDTGKKNGDKNIEAVLEKLRKVYPKIMRVRSVDRNHGVKEIILKEPKDGRKQQKQRKFKNNV